MLEGQTFKPNSPLGQFIAILPLLDLEDTGAAIDLAIEKLDKLSGDADLEDDDRAGVLMLSSGVDYDPEHHDAPGLEDDDPAGGDIVDEAHDPEVDKGAEEDGEPDDDAQGDVSWTEFHTRGRHKLDRDAEPIRRKDGWRAHEDDEDDDPAEDSDDDRCAAGDDHMIAGPVMQRDQWERWEAYTGHAPGDDVDAEPDSDTELNGDEDDYSEGAPWE